MVRRTGRKGSLRFFPSGGRSPAIRGLRPGNSLHVTVHKRRSCTVRRRSADRRFAVAGDASSASLGATASGSLNYPGRWSPPRRRPGGTRPPSPRLVCPITWSSKETLTWCHLGRKARCLWIETRCADQSGALSAREASSVHPEISDNPPSGVTAPSQSGPPKAIA